MTDATKRRRKGNRSPGEGSVYRNGNRWRGAVTWIEKDGTHHRRVVSGTTAAETRSKLDDLRSKLRIGALSTTKLTVGDYLLSWLERNRHSVRPSTHRGREIHIRVYLMPALGRIDLAKLSAADVERALAGFMEHGRMVNPKSGRGRPQRPISPLTALHVRATLRRALTFAVKDGLVARNAAGDASPPYVPHRPIAYLDRPGARRLMEASADTEVGPLITLAVTTGLRLGELLGLRWSDVDLDAGTLSVRQALQRATKGWMLAEPKSAKSRRTIPLPAAARAALEVQRIRQDSQRLLVGDAWDGRAGLVFTDEVGRPADPHRVSSAFHRAREAAGIPRVRLHDLRHTTATLLLAEGVPLSTISKWLGHAAIAITDQYYAAVMPELEHAAAAAMDRAMEPGR